MKNSLPPHAHLVFETITSKNFDSDRYMLANPDVYQAARRDMTFDARQHWNVFGKKERRTQVSSYLMDPKNKKFTRIGRVLKQGEKYNHIARNGGLPITFTDAMQDISAYDGESANPSDEQWIEQLHKNPDSLYLDLGCGLRDVVYENCVYTEIYQSLSADVIIKPNQPLPFKDSSFDGIYCAAVLEHVENPFFVASEIARVAKAGAIIIIDWPFLQPVHGYPSHYFNATRMGLRRIFEDEFEIESLVTKPSQTAAWALNWILGWFLDGIRDPALRAELRSLSIGELADIRPDSENYARWLGAMSDEMQMKLACGNTLVGRRRSATAAGGGTRGFRKPRNGTAAAQ